MRSDIWMNTNGIATKGLAELNNHTRDEQKNVRDGTYGNAQGLSEEYESRFNDDAKFMKCEPNELEGPLGFQRTPQQPLGPQGPVVRWERFLPLRSLKVLLVENDDSTRQVVSALLRNCSYVVTAVANGLQAWKTLEDLSNPVDLVLMEVVMPGLSGVELLYKIMSHKTCKNIPVIMMSSNDSMDIVFKCLSKGAVDFLVKPIRKNELKNLWQHVWRKCHSSSGSGSGSESGIRTQKSLKSKSVEESDNNTGSNEEDNASTGLNFRDGSDDGSGTQSSWTKRAVEVDSPQPVSPWGQPADPPDSTCALVIHSREEAFSDNCLNMTGTRECNRKDDKRDLVGKGLEMAVPGCSDLQLEEQSRKLTGSLTGAKKEKFTTVESLMDCSDSGNSRLELESVIPNGELRKEAAKIGCSDHHVGCVSTKVPNDIPKMIITGNSIHGIKEIPSLDLSLKRPTDIRQSETSSQERKVLRHSGSSAFSRYNNTSTVNQAPGGNLGSISLKAAITESVQNQKCNATANQGSNESTNNNDMGSTTNNAFAKAAASSEKPMPKSAVDIHSRSTVHPERDSHISSLQSVILNKEDATKVNTVLEQARSKNPQIQVQHHHHHYHHHHHHVHSSQQQKELLSNEDFVSRTVVIETQHSGLPGVSTSPVEGNAANYSLDGSVSGSNNGRKSSNMAELELITEGTNMLSDNGAPDAGGAGGGDESASGSRSAVDQNRLTPREAALNKFRQKRKERCFEKKVRYQSRKRMAEERPRVRGQFVRQALCDSKSKDGDS